MPDKIKPTVPKFYCENCGNEVKQNSKLCPHCGKFFSSVRCPKCNYLGTTKDFTNGCPKCGYAITQNNSHTQKKNHKPIHSTYKSNLYDDPLPWWIYSIVIGITGILFVFFFKLG